MIAYYVCFIVGVCFGIFTMICLTFASYYALRQELGVEAETNIRHEMFSRWEYREQFWAASTITCFIISVCLFVSVIIM